ncbi:hypothetical protein TNCV_3958161 [Trichonephila clavipes]|nr:hypothetical protein TNCV_3958161 [Trichonephila clavipes]
MKISSSLTYVLRHLQIRLDPLGRRCRCKRPEHPEAVSPTDSYRSPVGSMRSRCPARNDNGWGCSIPSPVNSDRPFPIKASTVKNFIVK